MNNWKKGLKLILDITEHNKSQYPAMEIFIQDLLQEVGERVIGEESVLIPRQDKSNKILEEGVVIGRDEKRQEIIKTLQDYGVKTK